ncbi:MAG: TonB-dependent receptor [Acidobacteria bacterium]|nr:TonB-dependent receptor [Acidobacteriota bacterium]
MRFAAFLLAVVPLMAQSTGTIVGAVHDASGAVIPGAEVRALNELTGLEWTATTEDAGRFSFPRLPVGNYKVRVSKEGFRRFLSESFRLDADQNRQVTVTLDVGSTTESLTVTGAVAQVDTVSATLREVVDQKRIAELPLNGRNPVQLLLLVPGVVTGPASGSLSKNPGIAVNGARATSTNYLLDGGDNNDPQEGVAAVQPNPDALEEFSVLTNNFSAEYGRSSGGVVNAVTRSGTNQFHGSAFEFLRNDILDARAFFGLSKSKLRRNQYGGSFGGPIVHNKAFFFGSYEGMRQRRGGTVSNLFVPTAAERGGDFSASSQIPRDPQTNQPFPGNRIPSARFDPAAIKYMELLAVPPPNAAGGRHIFNRPETADTGQILGRVDYTLTASQRLSGRAFKTTSEELNGAGLPILRSEVAFDTWNVGGQHTWTITPSLLAVGQFTWNQSQIDRGPLPIGSGGGVSYQDMGIKVNRGGLDALGKELVPHYRGGVNGYWDLGQDNLVLIDRTTKQAGYSVHYTRTGHMINFGGEYRWSKSDRITANGIDPQFTFSGQFSGSSLADFLLGLPVRFTQGSVRINRIRAQTFTLFFQDDWKVHRHLSLSFGLRYEPFFPFYSADDELTLFRAGQQSQVYPKAPAGLVYAGDAGIPRGGTPKDSNNLAPRLGFSWSPFGSTKTSIRGAYGIFYDTPRFHEVSHFVNSPPYSLQITVNQPRSLSDPYSGRVNPFPYKTPATPPEKAAYTFLLPVTVGLSMDPDIVAPYNHQWNFNVQREVAKDYLFTASYVGTNGTRLPIRNELNPALFRPGATLANIDARRIYTPSFASIVSYQNVINSTYHAWQLSLNKRFSNGFTVLAGYTWSKALDGASLEVDAFNGQDPLNLRADKGLADFDIRHRLVTSFLWELPSPKSGVARWVLGGWQSNGIFTISAGSPFTVVSGQDRALSGAGTQRPDLIGNPHLDTGRSREELINKYFESKAYTLPALGAYGNSGRNTLIGPGRWNLDFALFKAFHARERWALQYRWEMFNAFNHANLGGPRANISAAGAGSINTTSEPRIMQMGLRLTF